MFITVTGSSMPSPCVISLTSLSREWPRCLCRTTPVIGRICEVGSNVRLHKSIDHWTICDDITKTRTEKSGSDNATLNFNPSGKDLRCFKMYEDGFTEKGNQY